MRIAVPAETAPQERRVALVPESCKKLIQSGYEVSHVEKYWDDTAAFLMMAAIIFVISQIFNKGIELQNENDLTV